MTDDEMKVELEEIERLVNDIWDSVLVFRRRGTEFLFAAKEKQVVRARALADQLIAEGDSVLDLIKKTSISDDLAQEFMRVSGMDVRDTSARLTEEVEGIMECVNRWMSANP